MTESPWTVQRELLTKVDEEADPAYGSLPRDRLIRDYIRFGIVNLDKPSGPTSHEVAAWLKKILHVAHAGHGGTLDPKVTGVLPVALEEATKAIGILLLSGKEYVCVMRLHDQVDEGKVRGVLNEFVGDILQRPPLRSSVQRNIRVRRIYYIHDLEFSLGRVLFTVGCQAGTYIRKLCFDVGEALGTGAHMEELRRTRTGPFTEDQDLVSLYDLQEAYEEFEVNHEEKLLRRYILPVEAAFGSVPRVFIRDSAVDAVCHGAKLAVPGIAKIDSAISPRDTVGLFTLKGELVGIGRASMSTEQIMELEHGLAFDTLRVVLPIGTYPRIWQHHSSTTR
jgi:H/ACA ribonucleoprotein complex subunit 4